MKIIYARGGAMCWRLRLREVVRARVCHLSGERRCAEIQSIAALLMRSDEIQRLPPTSNSHLLKQLQRDLAGAVKPNIRANTNTRTHE